MLCGRRTVLPLVSRQWAAMLGGPGPAWARVDLSLGNDELPAALSWLQRRASGIRHGQPPLRHALSTRSAPFQMKLVLRAALQRGFDTDVRNLKQYATGLDV